MFRWEAAHRLINNYPKNCKHLHGHSYVAKVVVALRPHAKLNEFGFVKDYADFAPLKQWIDETLDHTTMVAEQDRQLQQTLEGIGSKAAVLPIPQTSAEHLCELLYKKAVEFLEDDRVYVVSVKINETCTSEAAIHVHA